MICLGFSWDETLILSLPCNGTHCGVQIWSEPTNCQNEQDATKVGVFCSMADPSLVIEIGVNIRFLNVHAHTSVAPHSPSGRNRPSFFGCKEGGFAHVLTFCNTTIQGRTSMQTKVH